jgi:hypothetical protein
MKGFGKIRLTESDLHRIVRESVNDVLKRINESIYGDDGFVSSSSLDAKEPTPAQNNNLASRVIENLSEKGRYDGYGSFLMYVDINIKPAAQGWEFHAINWDGDELTCTLINGRGTRNSKVKHVDFSKLPMSMQNEIANEVENYTN